LSRQHDISVACSGTPAHLALLRPSPVFRASFGLGAVLPEELGAVDPSLLHELELAVNAGVEAA
jgi:hypothetical protein